MKNKTMKHPPGLRQGGQGIKRKGKALSQLDLLPALEWLLMLDVIGPAVSEVQKRRALKNAYNVVKRGRTEGVVLVNVERRTARKAGKP